MASEQPIGITELNNREHIAPTKTGDNIAAKRVASYGFGADSNWGRNPLPLIDIPYDEIVFGTYDSFGNPSTITYKSGGVTVRTLTQTVDGSGNITDITRT